MPHSIILFLDTIIIPCYRALYVYSRNTKEKPFFPEDLHIAQINRISTHPPRTTPKDPPPSGTNISSKGEWKTLANRIEELLHGYEHLTVPVPDEIEALAWHYAKQILRKRRSEEKEARILEDEQDFREVDINALSSSDLRSLGPEHAGLEAINALGFFDVFRRLGFSHDEAHLAALQIVGRLVHPGSEQELRRYAREQSALDELMKCDFSAVGHNMLYRNADLLYTHKEALERFLRLRSREIFSLSETIILYDLTNTYFSGSVRGYTRAKRGRSKQKRK